MLSAIRKLIERWRVYRERKARLAASRKNNPDVRVRPMK